MPNTKPATVPTWADGAGAAITKPDGTKQAIGWASPEKPPAEWFNWWMNLVGGFCNFLNSLTGDDVPTSATDNTPISTAIAKAGGKQVGIRNYIQQAKTAFLSASATAGAVDLLADASDPFCAILANGYSGSSSVDSAGLVLTANVDAAWSSLPASATSFLYMGLSSGAYSYGITATPPITATSAPVGGNVTSTGTAVENGHAGAGVPENAFDGNVDSYWISLNGDASRENTDSIGRNFGSPVQVTSLTIAQGEPPSFSQYNCASSIQPRCSNDGVTWVNIGSPITIDATISTAQSVSMPAYTAAACFDVLYVAGPQESNSDHWVINELTLTASLAGRMYFDAIKGETFAYNSDTSAWDQSPTILVGEADTGSDGGITAVRSYAVRGAYRSGRVVCAPSTAYIVNHCLGSDIADIQVFTATSLGGALVPLAITSFDRIAVAFTTPADAAEYAIVARRAP